MKRLTQLLLLAVLFSFINYANGAEINMSCLNLYDNQNENQRPANPDLLYKEIFKKSKNIADKFTLLNVKLKKALKVDLDFMISREALMPFEFQRQAGNALERKELMMSLHEINNEVIDILDSIAIHDPHNEFSEPLINSLDNYEELMSSGYVNYLLGSLKNGRKVKAEQTISQENSIWYNQMNWPGPLILLKFYFVVPWKSFENYFNGTNNALANQAHESAMIALGKAKEYRLRIGNRKYLENGLRVLDDNALSEFARFLKNENKIEINFWNMTILSRFHWFEVEYGAEPVPEIFNFQNVIQLRDFIKRFQDSIQHKGLLPENTLDGRFGEGAPSKMEREARKELPNIITKFVKYLDNILYTP